MRLRCIPKSRNTHPYYPYSEPMVSVTKISIMTERQTGKYTVCKHQGQQANCRVLRSSACSAVPCCGLQAARTERLENGQCQENSGTNLQTQS